MTIFVQRIFYCCSFILEDQIVFAIKARKIYFKGALIFYVRKVTTLCVPSENNIQKRGFFLNSSKRMEEITDTIRD